jgi:hypothetical protein
MAKTTIDVHLHADGDYMYSKADQLGLTGEAARDFSFIGYEHKLTFEVDLANPKDAKLIAVDDRKLEVKVV